MVLMAMAAFAWWAFSEADLLEEADTAQLIVEKEQVIEQKQQEIELLQSSHSLSEQNYKLVCLECAREFSQKRPTNCPDDGATLVTIMR